MSAHPRALPVLAVVSGDPAPIDFEEEEIKKNIPKIFNFALEIDGYVVLIYIIYIRNVDCTTFCNILICFEKY